MNTTTKTNKVQFNEFGELVLENRYIGIVQLDSDDLGNNTAWQQYRQLCDNVVVSAYRQLLGGNNTDVLGMSVAGLFSFFGLDIKPTVEYQNRILASVIGRKVQKSEEYKSAVKEKTLARNNLQLAEEEEKSAEEISALKLIYEEKTEIVADLKSKPKHYWYDLEPMLDKKTRKRATAPARKAIEDCIADIINQRALMTIEQLQAEAQRLEDERKGRKARKKAEEKAKKQAEKEEQAQA